MLRLDQLGYLRSHAPGGWRADLTLDGLEHLHGALAAGRGAILWVAPTVFAPLLASCAARGGLSPAPFEPSGPRFLQPVAVGRLLNQLRTRIEDRHLAERVLLGQGNEAQAALRRIGALLRGNAVVSITVGRNGTRVADAALMGGRLQVASGAPHLAMRLGAALLPTTVWRTAAGGFVTRIWPALPTGMRRAFGIGGRGSPGSSRRSHWRIPSRSTGATTASSSRHRSIRHEPGRQPFGWARRVPSPLPGVPRTSMAGTARSARRPPRRPEDLDQPAAPTRNSRRMPRGIRRRQDQARGSEVGGLARRGCRRRGRRPPRRSVGSGAERPAARARIDQPISSVRWLASQ